MVWRKENLPIMFAGMYIGKATMENSMEAPQKKKEKEKKTKNTPTLQYHSWACVWRNNF